MPTAGAVVSDVAAILSGLAQKEKKCDWQPSPDGYVKPFEENRFSYYIRVKTNSESEILEAAELAFGSVAKLDGAPCGYVEFITEQIAEKDARSAVLGGALGEVESIIRILD